MKGKKAWGQGGLNEGGGLNRCFAGVGYRDPLAEKGKDSIPLFHADRIASSHLSLSPHEPLYPKWTWDPTIPYKHPSQRATLKGGWWTISTRLSSYTQSQSIIFLKWNEVKNSWSLASLLNVSKYKFISALVRMTEGLLGCFYFWVRQRPTREPRETDDAIFTLLKHCSLHTLGEWWPGHKDV